MGNLVHAARGALCLAAAGLSACASAPSAGGPEPTVTPQPGRVNAFAACSMEAKKEVAVLDATRERLHETVCGATLWFDGLFGERDLASARSAYGRLEVSTANSEFEGEDTRIRFDARVELPALQRRLSLFIGRDNEDDVARDRSEGHGLRSQADQLEQVEDWFAGIGYRLRERWGVRSQFRVGVRGLRHPQAYVQLRNTYVAYEDDNDRIQLRATPFANHLDGAGFTFGADFDHALAPTRLLRWSSIGTFTEESPGVEWRSAALLYQNLRELRSLALEAFERGATGAPEPLLEYGLRTIFRHPMFRRRLFAELVLGYSWPRVDPAVPRDGSAGVTFGLEMPFGTEPQ